MKSILIGLLLLSVTLGGGINVQASDPDHFIVFDMPEEQVRNQWGRIPWHGMPDDEMIFLSEATFKGDSLRLLAILVEWEDRRGTLPREVFDTLLFSRNVLPEGSLADYIHEVSYGNTKLTGDVIDWYDAGIYFDKLFPFSSLFPLLDPIIDYSLYDGNQDRKVDAICFIRSGTGEEDSQDPIDIWSYASVSDQGWGRYDDTRIDGWNTCPEFKPLRDQFNPMQFSGVVVRSGIRVFAHELAHNLGLPDLYDYDDKLNTNTYDVPNDNNDHPLVDWCPMGYYGYGYMSLGMTAASHYCGWSKIQLDLIEPITLFGEYNDLVIYNIETTGDSSLYKIPINGSNLEYFLLEYRNPQSAGKFGKVDSDFCSWFFPDLTFGYDELDRGLLITHIDDSIVSSTEWTSVNRGTPNYAHYTVCVEDAGYNPNKPETYNPEGHVTDSAQWWYPWETKKGALFSHDVPGQSEFGPHTTPNSDGYGGYSGVYVRVDSIVNERMYVYVNTNVEWLECCEIRGDVDDGGQIDALDLDYFVDYLYRGGPPPPCPQEADADDNGQGDILDLEYLIAYLFLTGPEPVACPIGGIPPLFSTTPVTFATYNQPYSYDAHADAEPVATYALTAFPVGMTIEAESGLVEWLPDDVGDYDVTISAANSWGTDYQSYTITVYGIDPVFTSTPHLGGVAGELYSYDADADGYPVPTYALATSPAGMTIDPVTGLVEWMPGSDGDYDVVVQALNSADTTPQAFTITVAPAEAPLITSTAITNATYSQLYSYDVEATGNPDPDFTLTTFPTGMIIDNGTGLIEWTPDDVGDYPVIVEATNTSGTDIQGFTISVAGIAPTFTSTPVTSATYAQLYSYDADADGYPAASYSLTTFPTGMTIDPVTGLIQWTPDNVGDYDVVVEAINSAGTTPQSFTITVVGIAPSFTSDPPLSGVVSYLYTYDANAGGYPAATYSLTTFPTGMTIDPITGLVEWTPGSTGDYDVVIEATNAYGTDNQSFTINVTDTPEPPVITSTPITTVTVGQEYTYDVEATGFPAPTYALTTAPSGMNINSTTGVIRWTPGSTGDYSVVVEATNANGTDTQSYTLTVEGIVPTFTSTPITTGTYNVLYEYNADATGNPTPTYALATFPAGMTINSGTGVVKWTPNDVGDFSVVVEAINSAGTTPQSYTLTISGVAPVFTSTPVTTGTYGQLYTYDANASGFPAANFTLTTFPTGMTIDPATGVIQWTPDATGDFNVVVEAANAYGTDIQSYTISVSGTAPSFTSTPITAATISQLYSYDADADGYPAPTYSLTTFPTGMTIDGGTGLVEWTPGETGDFSVIIEAANASGTDIQSFTITVSGVPEAPVITSTAITSATVDTPYSYDVEATGVPAPTFSLTTSPSGMSIDPASGLIQWTPGNLGDFDVVVEATNASGTDPQSFTITVSGIPPTFTSTPITTATYGIAWVYSAAADGNPDPTFALGSGPSGMVVNANTGVCRWSPDDVGDFDIVINAINSAGTTPQSFTLTVAGIGPTFTSTPVTTGTYGQLYTYDANTDGYPAATFSLTTYPTGMTIDPATGVIQWTPDGSGDYDVVVEAANAYGSDTQPFTITVSGVAPSFTSTPVTDGTTGVLYSYDADADGYPAITYSLTTFPTGMTIDGGTGLIEWTPDATGDFDVVVEATNTMGTDNQSFTISVAAPLEAPVITSTAVTSVTVLDVYSYDVDATGNPAPTFSLTTAPSQMSINSTTGLIQWTTDNGDLGDHSVVVEAANSEGTDTQSFTLTVNGIPPTITSTPVTTATYDVEYQYTVTRTGVPTPLLSLATGPAGMTANEVTGLVKWTPDDVGDFDVMLVATSSVGADTQSYTITVSGTAPAFTSSPVLTGTYGQLYTYDANADGYPAATYALTTYPTGMTIDANTGVIQWTPDGLGDYSVIVEATNAYGTDTQPFTITVSGTVPSFTSTPITTGTYGVLYTYDADADGYPAATYALTTYPTGMTIDANTGVIQWTPGDVGDYDVVIEATNSAGTTPQSFTISVSGTVPSFTSTPVTTGSVGVLYSYDADADGYPAATYSLTTYPAGMTIDSGTGLIEWTPGSSGDFDVVVEAANAYGTDTQSYTINVP